MSRRRLFPVTVIPGGGLRGLVPGRILHRLAIEYPELLSHVMLFAGTSTGAIIAAGLAMGLHPHRLVDLYCQHAEQIFDKRFGGGLIGSKYRPDGLLRLLRETFGTKTLASLDRYVLIPAVDLDSDERDPRSGYPRRAKAKFFEPVGDPHTLVVDALMASTAAPSYFPSYRGFVDGGLCANSPSVCAYTQARKYGAAPESIRMLSIGTGIGPNYVEGETINAGALWWAPKVAGLTIDSTADVSDHNARHLMGDNYHHVDAVLPRSIGLDDTSAIDELLACADAVDLAPTVAWLRASGWAGDVAEAA